MLSLKTLSIALLLLASLFSCDSLQTLARPLHQSGDKPKEKIYEPDQVDQKAKILRKSEPRYTEQARRNRTTGWVVLRVVLQGSGKIGEIQVIRGLPDGLTEECIKVAREIRFEPAVKDGQPVSMYTKVEYTFDVY
jgi:TonB family protein